MKEIWKDVIGYEGLYKVSNRGRVKSIKRKFRVKDKILSLINHSAGYRYVNLYKEGECSPVCLVHNLVVTAFKRELKELEQINHLDGDKTNNSLDNLEITTLRENISHRNGGAKGYYFNKEAEKWHAQIGINGKNIYLGQYDTEEEAGLAYRNALDEYGIINKYAN